ncbi:YtxH domain-containing protein [Geomobilimonas luticola]|uniref:YtxH domain-containing protein n=1 Tax=Geomobilimonas luticola TaxID=1114878 RepID=A0ABS5SBE8_9BACT|nr:YtxH domain-containing protein [Geomobilimonas luticola]MBT0652686.1 YtxH domain-containing protein [Geomobilimonas luticola]
MSDNENGVSTGTVMLSFLAGAAVGAGLALLYAPKSGRELREQISDLAEDAVDKIKEYTKEAQEKVKSTLEEGKDIIKEKKSILSTAIEAGKEAMEREKEKYKEA